MPDYEIFGTFFHNAVLSLQAGRVLAIFFKRSFSFDNHLQAILTDPLPLGILCGGFRYVLGFNALPFEAIVLLYTVTHLPDERVKTLALGSSFYLASFADLLEPTYATLALVIATTQFLRMPLCLKEKLRELRIVCGPVYIIAVSAWLRFAPTANFSSNPLSAVSALSVVCALSAALLFRPDNNQVLNLVLPQNWMPTVAKRTFIHGGLMFVSAALITIKGIATSPFHHSGVLGGVGIMNMCLYLAFKYSRYPRIT